MEGVKRTAKSSLPLRYWCYANAIRCAFYIFQIVFLQILTKDSVTCAVDAIIIARISEATMSIINIEDAHASVRLLAATTLRNILGTKTLGEILSQREQISHSMQVQTFHLSKTNTCFNFYLLLSCQPKKTMGSCFVYKFINDIESIDHLCINSIRTIGSIQKCAIDSH